MIDITDIMRNNFNFVGMVYYYDPATETVKGSTNKIDFVDIGMPEDIIRFYKYKLFSDNLKEILK